MEALRHSSLGRAAVAQKDINAAIRHYRLAARSPGATMCHKIQFATILKRTPASEREARFHITKMHRRIRRLLRGPAERARSPMNTNAFDFCVSPPFQISFYYSADWRALLRDHARLVARSFPELEYAAPEPPLRRPGERIRLGIVSAFVAHNQSSVMQDFGGMIRRLPRSVFEVTLIQLPGISDGRRWLPHRADRWLDLTHMNPTRSDCLDTARRAISALRLHTLFYLDVSMSSVSQQLAWSKLAARQIASHGHPVTSGLPRSRMHTFVSWAAAERPTARLHYSEDLYLLPAEGIHQFYHPRTDRGVSTVDGWRFSDLRKRDFGWTGPDAVKWYLTMQTTDKRHPRFDRMLRDIQAADRLACIIMLKSEDKGDQQDVEARLRSHGVDLKRVFFMARQPHHRLLALYRLSHVVLDSYPASGCTTTREALEVGGLVVTLPAKYLGSRWSAGYYSILGVTDLVAASRREYAQLAVRVANDRRFAARVRGRIRRALPRLFHQQSAVEAWTEALIHLSGGGMGGWDGWAGGKT